MDGQLSEADETSPLVSTLLKTRQTGGEFASDQHYSGGGCGEEDKAEKDEQGAVGGQLISGPSYSMSRPYRESRTLRYAKLVGMAAAFSLAALGANKVFDMLRK